MNVNIHESWKNVLQKEFEKQYFLELVRFVKNEYKQCSVFPPGKDIFRAFDLCDFYSVKVVIIGQDPYPGMGQANGLCFSVNPGTKIPRSLANIFTEIINDVGFVDFTNGDLSRWAEQGVLLLNATLTVRAGMPGSHVGHGWERFTDEIIKIMNDNKKHIVYILWGNNAKSKVSLINTEENLVLTSSHPSQLSVKGFWGNKHFSKTNEYLIGNGMSPINWT